MLQIIPDAASPEITLLADPADPVVPPGVITSFDVSVTATSEAPAGPAPVGFSLLDLGEGGPPVAHFTMSFEVAAAPDCLVRPSRELLVRDPSVVDDPVRTTSRAGGPLGAWTFGRLMERLAPTPDAAPEVAEAFLRTWLADQTVNGFAVRARRGLQPLLLDSWARQPDGRLDLSRAPFRLLAIVNRLDLRSVGYPARHDGEGRFVFAALDRNGEAQPFTIIFEYGLPGRGRRDARAWARAWHRLGDLPFPSEAYNSALQAITDAFTAPCAGGRGGDACPLTVRTNEAALAFPWEMRQFKAAGGTLVQQPTDQTPDLSFVAASPLLAGFINDNQQAIVRDRYVVPARLGGVPFLGGAAVNLFLPWTAPDVASAEARRHFSVNTCNGCHGSPETRTEFLHIGLRAPGGASPLSAFLVGESAHDPVTDEPVVMNDLGRRKRDLEQLVCRPAGIGERTDGIDRVH
jgi:hypothetical protein